MGFLLPRQQLTAFLKLLMRDSTLIAPLKRKADDVVLFEELHAEQDLRRLELAAIPQFSAKRFFMPAYEELFEYDMKDQELTDRKLQPRPRILFGLHLCDLNAVKVQDALFMGKQYVDDHYRNSRDHVYLVGWYCNTPPSRFCFCESMKLTNYYDLMLRELPGKLIYIDVGTPKGMLLMEKARALKLKEHHEQVPQIRTEKHLDTHDIRGYFDHPKWKEVTEELCLSCQRCTTMCPTCMCFGIYDETRPDLRHGVRKRSWDSCHSKEFTRVAGKHIFRPDRTARFKHRVYHKITYYPEAFGTPMCTGCGRCIEECPTEIDFVKIINDMQK
jgi:ferredoxin